MIQRLIQDLDAYPYNIQIFQLLKPQDPAERMQYTCRMLAEHYVNDNFVGNVWFSDECHILLSGHLNKQNMRFYGWQKLDECAQKPLHSQMVTVWCAISSHGIIGPYFLEDDDGSRCNVNSVVYREQVIDRFRGDLDLFCQLNEMSFDDQWFQQDGAPCDIGRGNLEYLQQLFGENLISRSSALP